MRYLVAILAFAVTPALANPIHRDRSGTLLIGDSMMRVGVGPVLRFALEERFGPPVELKAKAATGLARPDFYDWPKAVRELLEKRNYRQIVMMIGANDCQGISADGKVHKFASPSWKDIYSDRLLAMADQLCKGGRKVYWLTLPPMRPTGFNQRIQQLNSLLKKTLSLRPCIKIINLDSSLTNSGKFTTYIESGKKRLKIREPDGIHLTGQAGTIVSRVVIDAMSR